MGWLCALFWIIGMFYMNAQGDVLAAQLYAIMANIWAAAAWLKGE